MSTTEGFFQAGLWIRGDRWQETIGPFDGRAVARSAGDFDLQPCMESRLVVVNGNVAR